MNSEEQLPAGSRPTTRQRALRAAIEQLTPVQALVAIDQASARITGAIALTGALAGALGLVSAARLQHVGIGWVLPCLLAAGASVSLAVVATVPVRATLRPGDLSAMEWWFDRQIKRRVALIHWAAGLLVVAVLAAALPSVVSSLATTTSSVGMSLTATNADSLAVTAWGAELPSGATLQLVVLQGSVLLASARTSAKSGRSATSLVVHLRNDARVHGEVSITQSGKTLRRHAITLSVPHPIV